MLVFVMLLSAAPVLAEGEPQPQPQPQIDSVNLLDKNYDALGPRVSIELKNLPPINDNSIIEVKLYSEGKLLTKVRLAKLDNLTNATYLTCCIPFTGADEYWPQKPEFKPQRDVVADKAVLYVEGKEADVETFDLDRTAWNAMVPITSLAEETPQVESVLLSNDNLGRRVSINLKNLPPINNTSKIEVELYSREKLLTKVWLNPDKLSELDGSTYLTCCIPFTDADEYWPQDPKFKPQRDVVADKAVLYVEGKEPDVKTFDLDRTTWNALVPITSLAEETPQIESVLLSNDDFGRRVSINLKNLPPIDNSSIIEVELYSGDKLLTKVRLAKLDKLTNATYLTCCIPFTGADEYWPQDPVFKPQINVVADRAVLYVGGEPVDEMSCKLERTAWNALVPITPDDPYYPPYNPTPVQPTQPTQPGMLPPPTGDMPLWYAIVHFLGLA